MSVLTCPVCQGPMREIEKHGVLVDTCTQCRGVWLDRGELEKLAGVLGSDGPEFRAAPPYQGRPAGKPRERVLDRGLERQLRDDDDDDRYGQGHTKKTKMSRLMDFFD